MRRTSARTRRPRLAALVLAAGGSTRLGRPKQLLCLRGEPLLLRACRLAGRVADRGVIVVLGAGAQRLRSLLQRRQPELCIVHNANWREGIASSIRSGLCAVPPGVAGLLIVLVDQARIEAADLERLVARWRRRPGRAAAASHSGRVAGAPAIIPRRHFNALRSLAGDAGARALLEGSMPSLVAMPAAAFDVDTPRDLADL